MLLLPTLNAIALLHPAVSRSLIPHLNWWELLGVLSGGVRVSTTGDA